MYDHERWENLLSEVDNAHFKSLVSIDYTSQNIANDHKYTYIQSVSRVPS